MRLTRKQQREYLLEAVYDFPKLMARIQTLEAMRLLNRETARRKRAAKKP